MICFTFDSNRKARRKEKADVAGVTGGSSAGLGGGGLGLAGTVSLPGGVGGNGPTLGAGLVGHAGAHGQYGDAEHKLYLESTVLERKVPEADLRQLIDLPPGLDLNEWLASHSNFILSSIFIHSFSSSSQFVGRCSRRLSCRLARLGN